MFALFLRSSSSIFCHSEESNDEESCVFDSFVSHLRSFADAQDDDGLSFRDERGEVNKSREVKLFILDSSLCSE